MSGMPGGKRDGRRLSPLRAELPRILVVLGIGFMIIGLVATIALVASDSGCNAATNLSSPGGGPTSGSFCGHAHGFLTVSFLTLVAGAGLLAIGSMILPTLRQRDARRAGTSLPPPLARTDRADSPRSDKSPSSEPG